MNRLANRLQSHTRNGGAMIRSLLFFWIACATLLAGCGRSFTQTKASHKRFLSSSVMANSVIPPTESPYNNGAPTLEKQPAAETEPCVQCDEEVVTPSPYPSPQPPAYPVVHGSIPFVRVCSILHSEAYGNVQTVSPLELSVYDPAGTNQLCASADSSIKKTFLTRKEFTLPSSCKLPLGNYLVKLGRPRASTSILSSYASLETFSVGGVPIRVSQNGKVSFENGGNASIKPHLLFSAKSAQAIVTSDCDIYLAPPPTSGRPPPGGGSSGDVGGSGSGSPLILNLNPEQVNVKQVPLTSPLDGVWFDLLGRNAMPAPYTKKKTAWLKDFAFAWLTKPDGSGAVSGIDQLFGDNTMLLDGTFEPNGYAALARYDGTDPKSLVRLKPADGVIDRNDPIFRELRVWVDHDLNGVAAPKELFTLDQVGIASMDLNYDAGYVETDIHGNRTTMRSITKMRDGTLRMMFDLWLKYIH